MRNFIFGVVIILVVAGILFHEQFATFYTTLQHLNHGGH